MKILPAASLLPLYLLLLGEQECYLGTTRLLTFYNHCQVELGAAEHVLPIELKDRVQAHKRHTVS